MNRLVKTDTIIEGMNSAETSVEAAPLEVAAAALDVLDGLSSDVESADPNGAMVTVELFLHWSEGSSVAFLLNVMSAHYLAAY